MGPWTGQAGSWLGIPVPVVPLKGQILRLELAGPPLDYALYHSGGGYISSKPDGLTWVGTTEERVGFDDRSTEAARQSIMKGALEVMPVLSEARLALQTACLRPLSEDGLPIIGEVPGWEGVYLSTGAGRKGILLGPAMAQAIADLVTEGHTSLPVEPFSPGRFARV
jgi:glycine oxidase